MNLSKFLTARSTVISLFATLSLALLFAGAVPQRASLGGKTPAWVEQLPAGLHFVSTTLGLDNIVGTAWFAVLGALFWLSLVVSTLFQFKATRMLVNRTPQSSVPQGSIQLDLTARSFASVVSTFGYRSTESVNGVHRYVKNRLGYWGNFLLHVGLATTVFFSLIYVLTQHRIFIRLVGQEITRVTADTGQELRGIMPLQKRPPYSMALKTVAPVFWGNDKPKSLSSELYITDNPGDDPRRVDVALSDKAQFGPYLVYQINAFGRAFDLLFEAASGEQRKVRLFLPYPSRRDLAGYGEATVGGKDFILKGKFFADKEQRSMQLKPSPLGLRLFRGRELLGAATLDEGATARIGPYTVRMLHSEWWADFLLDGTYGTAGIFSGFALILLGVLSSYCLIPREIIVREANGTIHVQQLVKRFAPFYSEEFDAVITAARKTGLS